uniref:Uncharacterized protein n=1 Tax=Cyclopterus lumpus TaxID=8103 RepID=A0A8C2ZU60_CYCLU
MATKSEQVDQEPRGTNSGDHQRAIDLLGLGEPLDSLQDDGKAQRREEDRVDERPHHLRPDPPEGVFVSRVGFLGKSHRDQSHDQRNNVRQHMKGVRQHDTSLNLIGRIVHGGGVNELDNSGC